MLHAIEMDPNKRREMCVLHAIEMDPHKRREMCVLHAIEMDPHKRREMCVLHAIEMDANKRMVMCMLHACMHACMQCLILSPLVRNISLPAAEPQCARPAKRESIAHLCFLDGLLHLLIILFEESIKAKSVFIKHLREQSAHLWPLSS